MNYLAELGEMAEKTQEIKALVPIGVYGSFKTKNIGYLKAMRDYLRKNGYLAFISLDIQELCKKPQDMDDKSYNNLISGVMIKICQIHVVFLFKEETDEHNINMSAIMELTALANKKDRHVVVFHEKGAIDQLSSLASGLLKIQVDWAGVPFNRITTNIEGELLPSGISFCYNEIKTDTMLGYISKEDIYEQLSKICRETIR
jgi:hypothetical protein